MNHYWAELHAPGYEIGDLIGPSFDIEHGTIRIVGSRGETVFEHCTQPVGKDACFSFRKFYRGSLNAALAERGLSCQGRETSRVCARAEFQADAPFDPGHICFDFRMFVDDKGVKHSIMDALGMTYDNCVLKFKCA